jgi:Leucine-rich repeat (LRR) protein
LINFLIFSLLSITLITQSISEEIICNFDYDHRTDLKDKNSNFYQCEVKNTQIFNGGLISIETTTGQHRNGNTNSNVTEFFVSNAPNMRQLPLNLANVFTNLTLVDIRDSSLAVITENYLKPLKQLRYLMLIRNQITTIEDGTFVHNPALREIYLEHNLITHVDVAAFRSLQMLEVLDVSYNLCEDYERRASRENIEAMLKKIESRGCRFRVNESSKCVELQVIESLRTRLEQKTRKVASLMSEVMALRKANEIR